MTRQTIGMLITASVIGAATAWWINSSDMQPPRSAIVSGQRVIALSGDTVEVRDGSVLVNGAALSNDTR